MADPTGYKSLAELQGATEAGATAGFVSLAQLLERRQRIERERKRARTEFAEMERRLPEIRTQAAEAANWMDRQELERRARAEEATMPAEASPEAFWKKELAERPVATTLLSLSNIFGLPEWLSRKGLHPLEAYPGQTVAMMQAGRQVAEGYSLPGKIAYYAGGAVPRTIAEFVPATLAGGPVAEAARLSPSMVTFALHQLMQAPRRGETLGERYKNIMTAAATGAGVGELGKLIGRLPPAAQAPARIGAVPAAFGAATYATTGDVRKSLDAWANILAFELLGTGSAGLRKARDLLRRRYEFYRAKRTVRQAFDKLKADLVDAHRQWTAYGRLPDWLKPITTVAQPVRSVAELNAQQLAKAARASFGKVLKTSERPSETQIQIGTAKPKRFEIGKRLSKKEKRQILRSIKDVYKEHGAPIIVKGIDKRGEEIYGYEYRPDYFRISDITGRPVRYYITLPDGKIAHPTELFPNLTESEIDREIGQRLAEEKQAQERSQTFKNRVKLTVKAANEAFFSDNPRSSPDKTILLHKQGQYVRVVTPDHLRLGLEQGFSVRARGPDTSWADEILGEPSRGEQTEQEQVNKPPVEQRPQVEPPQFERPPTSGIERVVAITGEQFDQPPKKKTATFTRTLQAVRQHADEFGVSVRSQVEAGRPTRYFLAGSQEAVNKLLKRLNRYKWFAATDDPQILAERLNTRPDRIIEAVSELPEGLRYTARPGPVSVLPRKSEILAEIENAIRALKNATGPVPETVTLKIDGGITLANRLDALEALYERVKKTGIVAQAPKSIHGARAIPVQRPKPRIEPLHETEGDFWTDGTLLVKGKPPKGVKYGERKRVISQEEANEVLNTPTTPAKVEGFIWDAPGEGQRITSKPISPSLGKERRYVVFRRGNDLYVADQDRFLAIQQAYPNAPLGITREPGRLIAYKGQEPVAALGGIKLAKDKLSEEALALLKSKRGAEKTAPAGQPSGPGYTARGVVNTRIREEDVGDLRIKPITLRDINRFFQTELGVPVRGRATARARKYLGWYEPAKRLVRVFKRFDLATLLHEQGHSLDWLTDPKALTRMGRSVKEARDELITLGKRLYGKTQPAHGYANEGVAEFVAMWLVDPKIAEAEAPEFYKLFTERWLRTGDGKRIAPVLERARQLVRRYVEQGARQRILANVSEKSFQPWTARRIKQTAKALWRRFRGDWDDEVEIWKHRLRDAGVDLDKLPAEWNPVAVFDYFRHRSRHQAQVEFRDEQLDLWGVPTGKPGLRKILAPVAEDANTFRRFTAYMLAKSAQAMKAKGMEIPFEPSDVDFILKTYQSGFWDDFVKRISDWNTHALELYLQAKGISRDRVERMKASWPLYIPMWRHFLPGEIAPFRGRPEASGRGLIRTTKGRPYRRFGSRQPMIDPWRAMFLHNYLLRRAAQRAYLTRVLSQVIGKARGGGALMAQVPAPKELRRMGAKKLLSFLRRNLLKRADEEEAENLRAAIDTLKAFIGQQGENVLIDLIFDSGMYRGRDLVLPVYQPDGTRKWYEVDPEIYSVFLGLDPPQWNTTLKLLFEWPSRFLRLGATGISPRFSLVRNAGADQMTWLIYRSRGHLFEPLTHLPALIKETVGKRKPYTELTGGERTARLYSTIGGPLTGFVGSTAGESVKSTLTSLRAVTPGRKAMELLRHPIQAIETAFSIRESMTRITEFAKTLEQLEAKYGMNHPRALIEAMNKGADVVLNYSKAGRRGRLLNRIIWPANARIRDVSKLLQYARRHPDRFIRRGFIYLTVPAVIAWWHNKDKDWWKSMGPWKYTRLWVEVNGKPVGLPLVPFNLGALFMTLPVALLDYAHRHDDRELIRTVGNIITEATPTGWPPIPTSMRPVIDVLRNRKWTGAPIESRRMESMPPDDRYLSYTSEFAKIFARQINKLARLIPGGGQLSPVKLEYLLNSYTGGLYGRMARSIDLLTARKSLETEADWPVIGALFVHDPDSPRRELEIFYERLNELSQKKTAKRATPREELLQSELARRARQLSPYWKALANRPSREQRKRLWSAIRRIVTIRQVK